MAQGWRSIITTQPDRKSGCTRIYHVGHNHPGNTMTDLAVQVIFPNMHAPDHCTVLFDDDGEYQPFLYDYARKKIVQEEAPNLRRMERYRRYSLLDPQDTFTVQRLPLMLKMWGPEKTPTLVKCLPFSLESS